MATEAEMAILSLLGAANIHFEIYPRGAEQNALGGNTEMDKWKVIISNVYGNAQSFDYFTGKGHRKYNSPVTPHIAGVLYSLLLDAEAVNYSSFEEWADCFGYDTDSRKAERIYHACRENGEKLNKIISGKVRENLAKVLQDY